MPSSKSPTKQRSSSAQPAHEWAFEAIGTHFWIGIYEPCDVARLTALQADITDRIETFDMTYSRFRSDSLVTRIAQTAGTYSLPPDADKLITLYDQLYTATNGLVTPLIGQALSDAGYNAVYSLQPNAVRSVPAWPEVCSYDDGVLKTTQPVLLDFGAAGKGYLVDLLAELVQQAGITRYCVDGSGDLICKGLAEPLAIGLENPHDASQVIGVAQLQNAALCGSSGARRAWGDYTHILDPRSLVSPKHIAAVWTVADSCMVADGLTTALYFASPSQLRESFNFEYAIMFADSSIDYSTDFPAELFIVKPTHA